MKTYGIWTRDPGSEVGNDWFWNLRFSGLTLWKLRDAIRSIRAMGYTSVSFLIEQEGWDG